MYRIYVDFGVMCRFKSRYGVATLRHIHGYICYEENCDPLLKRTATLDLGNGVKLVAEYDIQGLMLTPAFKMITEDGEVYMSAIVTNLSNRVLPESKYERRKGYAKMLKLAKQKLGVDRQTLNGMLGMLGSLVKPYKNRLDMLGVKCEHCCGKR